eukprot:gene18752-20641_t
MEYISLKPDRELINAKFDSYHLGTDTLELKSLNLLQPVAYYPLTEDHYSYFYLRAHAQQNLLVLDRWNENEDALYFIDNNFAVMGLTFNKSSGTFGSHLKLSQFPTPLSEKIKEHISPSLSFPSSETCLFNDGAGKLYLVATGRRESQLENQRWICDSPNIVFERDTPFYICHATTDNEENIHCVVMSLELETESSASTHPKVFFYWLMFVENKKESNSAGDQFICHVTKKFSGASVPSYVSPSPDFNSLIIACQGQVKLIDEDAAAKQDDKSDAQQENDASVDTMVVNEVEKQSSAYTGEQIEECDMETEDDLKLSVLSKEDGKIKLQTPLSGHQWLFNINHNPVQSLHFCVRHDVDGLLWKPVLDDDSQGNVAWKHVTTFNAIGYVQASKKNHKYVTCGQTNGFVAIVDCARNIYVYITKSLSDVQGTQYVMELPTSEEILGVKASTETLFVMCKNAIHAISVL